MAIVSLLCALKLVNLMQPLFEFTGCHLNYCFHAFMNKDVDFILEGFLVTSDEHSQYWDSRLAFYV